jgi:hypothetical protein
VASRLSGKCTSRIQVLRHVRRSARTRGRVLPGRVNGRTRKGLFKSLVRSVALLASSVEIALKRRVGRAFRRLVRRNPPGVLFPRSY